MTDDRTIDNSTDGSKPNKLDYYTQQVIAVFKEGTPGVSSYTRNQLAMLLGMDVNPNTATGKKGYGYVGSAIKHVRNNHNLCWQWSRQTQRYECLSPSDIVAATNKDNKAAARRLRVSVKKMRCVKTEELTQDEAVQHRLNSCQAQLALSAVSSPMRKHIQHVDTLRTPTLEEMKEMFK